MKIENLNKYIFGFWYDKTNSKIIEHTFSNIKKINLSTIVVYTDLFMCIIKQL